MAEKGVMIEYDFAVIDGASLLYNTTENFLRELDGIPFDSVIEARHFAGGDYQSCFAKYFPIVKTKKTALKAGRDLDAAFRKALEAEIVKGVPQSFVEFVRELVSRQIKVVISTRADLAKLGDAFAAFPVHGIVYRHEESTVYGSVRWEVWRRICIQTRVDPRNAVAATGSGLGVKAALRGGLGAVAVTNPRTAYQDYTGCDEFFTQLDAAAARRIMEILKV